MVCDLNGNIGLENEGIKVHGGKGVRVRNQEGESELDFAVVFEMVIVNMFFFYLQKVAIRHIKSGPVKVKLT